MKNLFFIILLSTLLISTASVSALAHKQHLEKQDIKRLLLIESHKADVDDSISLSVAKTVSNMHHYTLGENGRIGVMQISPEYAWHNYGISKSKLWLPETNIRLGVNLLRISLIKSQGDLPLALEYYFDAMNYSAPPQAELLVDKQDNTNDAEIIKEILALELDNSQNAGNLTSNCSNYRFSDRLVKNEDTEQKNSMSFLDDFGGTIETRRLMSRHLLDDFTPQFKP